MRSSIKRLGPLLGALLLLAELGIAMLAVAAPHVSETYYDFYIAGSRSCWLPDKVARRTADELRVPRIEVAALRGPAACYFLNGGWSGIEDWGVWSDGPVSGIELPRLAGKTKVSFTVIAYSPRDRQSVKIDVDGVSTGSMFVPNQGRTTLTVNVPPGPEPDLHVTFRIKHPAAPQGVPDKRRLGIGLIAVDWN